MRIADLEAVELNAALGRPILSWPAILYNWRCLARDSTVLVDTFHRHHVVLQLNSQVGYPVQISVEC